MIHCKDFLKTNRSMNPFRTYTLSQRWALVLVGLLTGVALSRLLLSNPLTDKPRTQTTTYTANLIRLTRHLANLQVHCRQGRVDYVQNTFLELKQEWQFQDVLAKSAHEPGLMRQYVPSDSLYRLENYIRTLTNSPDTDRSIRAILAEIKRMNEALDRMQRYK